MDYQANPLRSEVPDRYKWNAPSVFASEQDWEAARQAALAATAVIQQYQGRLCEGPAVVAEVMTRVDDLMRIVSKLSVYAGLSHAVDMTDQNATRLNGKSQALVGQALAAIAFIDPELIALGEPTVRAWLASEPRLAYLTHYVDNLFRKQAHIRSAEVEEVLGMLADPFSNVDTTMGMLTDVDFRYPPAVGNDGRQMAVTQGTLTRLLADPDRELRRTAWEGYHGLYYSYRNVLAANLTTSVKQDVFRARVRRHSTALEASQFEHAIPTTVFHNLIEVFRRNLPTWHRYWEVRRRALGVQTLEPYDVWAPLTRETTHVPYEQAVDWICAGLAPLGADYVEHVRRGCLQERWVDVYPTNGKGAGAFSTGAPDTYPFIMMSYNDDVFSLSTLAHELGHSMHSLLTWKTQPLVYADYSLFVAEVASNFHQAMVRDHLLQQVNTPAFQINLIEEAMSNFHRYFFIMPTLARFELEVHTREERGQGMTGDDMVALMADLFSEGYGSGMHVDRERVGITWATFGHLYVNYYVYQYATGISGAHALAHRIRSGEPGAVADYLTFLKSGSSLYPLDALQRAGVDLTTPEPVEAAFTVLSAMVDRLAGLVGA